MASPDKVLNDIAQLLESDPEDALNRAREALRQAPTSSASHRLAAKALRRLGRAEEAERFEMQAVQASAHNPVLVQSAVAIKEGRWRDAEHHLRPYLRAVPDDAAALNMMGQVAAHVGAHAEAESLFRDALEAAPAFSVARLKLADALLQQGRHGEALHFFRQVVEREPGNFRAKAALAGALAATAEYRAARALYEELLQTFPDRPPLWMSYGHVLKTLGFRDESLAAYRRAQALDPNYGEVWWSIANVKAVTFGEDDIATMIEALGAPSLAEEQQLHFHFALGKALEDARRFEPAFEHYTAGNAIRRRLLPHNADRIGREVEVSKAVYTREFFSQRKDVGDLSRDPIFILGMPRAGSTLIEQILASHSAIEGTSELPYIPALARGFLFEAAPEPEESTPRRVARLDAEDARLQGETYLDRARIHRKSDRPHFIDKLPNNWLDVGFIHLILPNAKIIDARRHPLDCCFSNFKQHFARGQTFAYDLEDLGLYYRAYVDLMEHFDRVLPGRVHRVIHERLVDDPEAEIRALLEYLELPYEEACLRFHENERAVRTPSAEQVRKPLNRSGMDRWKPFEAWLSPLKTALGSVLEAYPDVPDDLKART